MTSNNVRNRGLGYHTRTAYELWGLSPQNFNDRLAYWLTYLEDVVRWGITVHHVPRPGEHRQQIQLRTFSGKIFMSGLLSLENSYHYVEPIAADRAYTRWVDRRFVADNTWRFFTITGGTTERAEGGTIRLYNSHHGENWDLRCRFESIESAYQLAAYLQQEFDSLPPNARL